MTRASLALLAALATPALATLYKSPTPPMGWNSYNYYDCNPTEAIIKANAQGLVDLGLVGLGYEYVTTDCGWMADRRDNSTSSNQGRLQWDRSRFPSGGGKALGDYLHGLGLKFGLYSGAGYYQCGSTDLPASLGYEEIDAETFADWGGDSLKYDNCFASSPTQAVDYSSAVATSPSRHQKMAAVLDTVSRDIAYFICQWGVGTQLEQWAPPIGNSYRISNDIYGSWRSIWRITNQVVPFWRSTKPGAFPDMDMLIVGLGGLSHEEEKFHFSMWAMNKSPLTIGAPALSNLTSSATFEILGNREIIAINQDPLGKQARLVRRYTEEEWDIWAGELSGARQVLGIANWRNDSQTVRVDLVSALGISKAEARDVWANKDKDKDKDIGSIYEVSLAAHEMKVLVLSNITKSTQPPAAVAGHGYYYSAANATLAGGANKVSCNSNSSAQQQQQQQCAPAGNKISLPRAGATASWDVNITTPTPPQSQSKFMRLGVDYINYDIALGTAWGWGTNTRNMTITVNGGAAKRWAFPISGGDWWESDRLVVEVEGLRAGKNNKVLFGVGAGAGPAPDLVGFEVLG